jgi:hypothetical protein
MKALARTGAEARIGELQAEIAEIQKAFPGIGGAKRGRPAAPSAASAEVTTARSRRSRKPMSAAQKKAVGIRMKAYWAKRRKATAKAEKKE